MFQKKKFRADLAKIICNKFGLNDLLLSEELVSSTLKYYEISFFSILTGKESNRIIISLLAKINSDIAKQADTEKLRDAVKNGLIYYDDCPSIINQNLYNFILKEIAFPEEKRFSKSIIDYMSFLKKTVEELTNDQFYIIEQLRHFNRVLVLGCAGSGKTLLAAEKAKRLDSDNTKTLVLCHNPYLAKHIKCLINNNNISVLDFTSWVNTINEIDKIEEKQWNIYVEPTECEISTAFDKLSNSETYFDAIIVDEAQDFREMWWLLVEIAISKSEKKILYIFSDSNQNILPYRTKYPIKEISFKLSKNIRSDGNICSLINKLHPDELSTSYFLKDLGITNIESFQNDYFDDKLKLSIIKAKEAVGKENVIILTNESSAEKSILNDYKISLDREKDQYSLFQYDMKRIKEFFEYWYNLIDDYYTRFHGPPIRVFKKIKIPVITQRKRISNEEIDNIHDFVYSMKDELKYIKELKASDKFRNFLYIFKKEVLPKRFYMEFDRMESILSHYSQIDWYEKQNYNSIMTIKANDFGSRFVMSEIPLFTIDMYKGLESDAIILFIHSSNDSINSELYIGASRAIAYLDLIVDKRVLGKVRYLDNLRKDLRKTEI